jgi:hypothetical protein
MWKNVQNLLKGFPIILGAIGVVGGSPAIAQDDSSKSAPASLTVAAAEEKSECGGDWNSSQCCDGGWMHSFDECKWVKLGVGLRASYNRVEDGGATAGHADGFNVDNARIYLSGQAHPYIGFEFNTDINNAQGFEDVGDTFDNGGEMRILDAVIKMKLTDSVNLWVGRFLPPSDRANLSGPFYQNSWEFPWAQFGYHNIFQGRDDGMTLWGQVDGGKFKWAVGLFEGVDGATGAPHPNDDDHVMFTARVVANLLDPEPGYYNQSTYYGEKEILAIGASIFNQTSAVGLPSAIGHYTAWNIDILWEHALENCGVVTVEGAYYDFDDDDAAQSDPSGIFTDTSRQGDSYFILASYLMPNEVNLGNLSGRFQPSIRYLEYERDFAAAGDRADQIDYQLNYIMEGHNSRIAMVMSSRRRTGVGDRDFIFRLGYQVQF